MKHVNSQLVALSSVSYLWWLRHKNLAFSMSPQVGGQTVSVCKWGYMHREGIIAVVTFPSCNAPYPSLVLAVPTSQLNRQCNRALWPPSESSNQEAIPIPVIPSFPFLIFQTRQHKMDSSAVKVLTQPSGLILPRLKLVQYRHNWMVLENQSPS